MTPLQRWAVLLSGLFLSTTAVNAEDLKPLPGQESVRVCADGYNMPYSNKEQEGFDNRIADTSTTKTTTKTKPLG